MTERRILFSAQRNEGPFITEWVAYHRAIGFTDVVVVSNDCDDGSDDLLDALAATGAVHHIRQQVPADVPPQKNAAQVAMREFDFRDGDWVMWLDLDEFLIPSLGAKRLDDLIDAAGEAQAIMVGWRFFGDAGQDVFPGRQYSPLFDKAAIRRKGASAQAKTLFRFSPLIAGLDIHRPALTGAAGPENFPVITSAGVTAAPEFFDRDRRNLFNRLTGVGKPYRLAQVAHYSIRSPDMYALKQTRGDGYFAKGSDTVVRDDAFYAKKNRNDQESTDHLVHYAATTDTMQHLLSDPAVLKAHLAASGALTDLRVSLPHLHAPDQPDLAEDASPLPPGLGPLMADVAVAGGFVVETDHHVLAYIPGQDRLVVAFDNLSSNRETENRRIFGEALVRRQGWGLLGVIVKRKDWFQCPQLKAAMEQIRDRGLFESYPQVSFYGSSMGGFGACTFCALSPGATVVAMSPQSSLAPHIDWETRYRHGRSLGVWEAPFADAADHLSSAGKVYLFYDPTETLDLAHIDRLRGPNTIEMRSPHFSHKVMPMYRRMGVLKDLALGALTGELDSATFHTMMRQRRSAPPYLVEMLTRAAERGHLELARDGADRAVDLANNWKTRQLRRSIRNRLNKPDT